jgi:hypothetical protein
VVKILEGRARPLRIDERRDGSVGERQTQL